MAARTGLTKFAIVGGLLFAGLTLVRGDDAKTVQPPANPPQTGQPRVAIEPRQRPNTEAAGSDRRTPNLTVTRTEVQINVTVTTPNGRVVTAMEKEHFKLFEDNVEQEITNLRSEDVPLSVGLVFDISGSMSNKIHRARQAAAAFFRSANPEDEFFLVQFNDKPELTIPFTTNTEEILNRMAFTQTKGRTALLDGVYLAMNEMKKHAKNTRKAILILSDGGDNSSRYTESEILSAVREADVMIYAMGVFEAIGGRHAPEEAAGPGLLSDIAERTGGRHFPVENLNHLADTAVKIGLELRSVYMLSYTPTNTAKDGKYRRVTVKVVQPRGLRLPQLRAFFRQGYYAPTE